jgi:hypothetical protein
MSSSEGELEKGWQLEKSAKPACDWKRKLMFSSL